MNVQCLIDEGLLEEIDGVTYMTENLKTILTFHNAMNPDRPIKLGTIRTYADRHNWKKKSVLAIDQTPIEDNYN